MSVGRPRAAWAGRRLTSILHGINACTSSHKARTIFREEHVVDAGNWQGGGGSPFGSLTGSLYSLVLYGSTGS